MAGSLQGCDKELEYYFAKEDNLSQEKLHSYKKFAFIRTSQELSQELPNSTENSRAPKLQMPQEVPDFTISVITKGDIGIRCNLIEPKTKPSC
ncbi:hypothetical protein U1Q18_045616 [Sarracenia purpurea var. burkii]